MLWKLILFAIIGGVIVVFLKRLFNTLLETKEIDKVDSVFSLEKKAYDKILKFLQEGYRVTSQNPNIRNSIFMDFIVSSAFDLTMDHLKTLDPEQRIMKEIEKRLNETLICLEIARRKATENNDSISLEHLEHYQNVLNSFSLDRHSIKDILTQIELINEKLKLISAQYTDPMPNQTSTENYYKILNIAPDATSDQIKEAFHDQCKKWHPDRIPSYVAEEIRKFAENRMKLINEANETLSNPEKRRQYDEILRGKDNV